MSYVTSWEEKSKNFCWLISADMWMRWGRSQQFTRRSEQSCQSFAQSLVFLLAPARLSTSSYGFNLMQALSYIWHKGAEEHLIQVHACSWSYLTLRFWEAGKQVSSRAWQLLRRSEECPGSATQRRTWNELPSRRPDLTRGKEQHWRRCPASSTNWPSGKNKQKTADRQVRKN